VSERPEGWAPGRRDGAPRGLLDFEPDRAIARQQAEAEWSRWHDIASRYPKAWPASAFLSRHDADPVGYPLEAARRDHRNQPVMRRSRALPPVCAGSW
jgi:hypothetical protein